MNAFMFCERRILMEGFTTNVTRIQFLASVNQGMSGNVCCTRKHFAAHFTRIRFLSSVGSHMKW
jgi:hypothetical protein